MSFPYNVKIVYSADENLPISTLESTHFIQDWDDVEILTRLLNSFSVKFWSVDSVKRCIIGGGFKFKDEFLTIEVI